MIIKYFNGGVWAYIDNVRQAAKKDMPEDAFASDNKNPNEVPQPVTKTVSSAIDKAFAKACVWIGDISGIEYGNADTQNLLDGDRVLENYPTSIIMLYLNDHKEYDTLVLVTNQDVYLMSDKGQTIERLV